jgi:urease accessory protein
MNLALLQLGDSALPIGGYSHSWGLEAAVDRGDVATPEAFEGWVHDWLRFSLGPAEGVVMAAAFQAIRAGDVDRIRRANDYLETGLVPPSLRQASRDMGEQLRQLAERWPWIESAIDAFAEGGPWHHAVVFGALAGSVSSDVAEALGVYLHQAALGMIGAGVRAIPIGHTHGQLILARLHAVIEELAAELKDRELETAGSFCPAYEEFCHAQQHLYTRLFRS